MYKWYVKQINNENNNNNLLVIVYDSQKPAKNENLLEPFIKKNIISIQKSPIQNYELFNNGIFTIIDDNKSMKNNLFFLFPTSKLYKSQNIFLANHFTFCYDKSDPNKACHFHTTEYNCKNNTRFLTEHIKDFFSDKLIIPKYGDIPNIIKRTPHLHYKPFILDLLRLPWINNNNNNNNSVGGAKTQKQIARNILSNKFSQLWTQFKFKSMNSFGFILPNNHVIWNVDFIRKGRESRGLLQQAYIFETTSDNEILFQNTLANLIENEEF
jgi:hypothetical protein